MNKEKPMSSRELEKLSASIQKYVEESIFPFSGWQKAKFNVERLSADTMTLYAHLSGFGVSPQDYYELGTKLLRRFKELSHTSINGTTCLGYWARR